MANFREQLGQSESSGNYGAQNQYGYTGKYQFGPERLADFMKDTGQRFSMEQFRKDPALQEQVQAWHEQDIMDYAFNNGLDYFFGKQVGGVTITPTSLIAMAHLGGKKGMRKFVETNGEYNPKDANGTSLRDYGQKFGGGVLPESSQPEVAPSTPTKEERLAMLQQAINTSRGLTETPELARVQADPLISGRRRPDMSVQEMMEIGPLFPGLEEM